jgi:ABC-type glycerol-3-phosphate transport system substrate-binding protein
MRPVLLLTLLALLAGCAPAPVPPQTPPGDATSAAVPSVAPSPANEAVAPVTITFGVDKYEPATYELLAQRFMAERPDITVQIVPLPEPDIGTDGTFQIAGFQRRVAEAADSFNAWINADEALQAGLLLDLAPLIDADPSFDRANFLPGAIAPHDGTISSIPRYLFTPLYAYNRDLLARRGVSEPPPDASFAQLLERAEQVAVVVDDNAAIYGIWSNEVALDALTVLLRERGIDLGDGAPPLSDPHYADALAELEVLVSTNAILNEALRAERPYRLSGALPNGLAASCCPCDDAFWWLSLLTRRFSHDSASSTHARGHAASGIGSGDPVCIRALHRATDRLHRQVA